MTFDGPVSRPGLWGHGPAQTIFDILDGAFQQALQSQANELAKDIRYSPYHIATAAVELSAPGLIDDAGAFYARAYHRVVQYSDRTSAPVRELVEDVVEVLFNLADRVGGHALALGGDDLSVDDAKAQLVNEAAFAVAEGVAAADDVDTGMTLGLRHPKGPGAWRRDAGGAHLRAILDALWNERRDPRYRPAPGFVAEERARGGTGWTPLPGGAEAW